MRSSRMNNRCPKVLLSIGDLFVVSKQPSRLLGAASTQARLLLISNTRRANGFDENGGGMQRQNEETVLWTQANYT